MLANWPFCLRQVLASEGGYVNNPLDPGGATNLGVTIGEAKSVGLDVNHNGKVDILDIKALTPADAGKVFKAFYWDKVSGDGLPSGVDYSVFDYAVNSGPVRAAISLQEILGVAPDGKIGPLTLAAAKTRNADQLVLALYNERMAFLQKLSAYATFGRGWAARCTRVRTASFKLAAGP